MASIEFVSASQWMWRRVLSIGFEGLFSTGCDWQIAVKYPGYSFFPGLGVKMGHASIPDNLWDALLEFQAGQMGMTCPGQFINDKGEPK